MILALLLATAQPPNPARDYTTHPPDEFRCDDRPHSSSGCDVYGVKPPRLSHMERRDYRVCGPDGTVDRDPSYGPDGRWHPEGWPHCNRNGWNPRTHRYEEGN